MRRRRKWRRSKGFDACNQDLVAVRGFSPCDVLKEAKIIEFGRLLDLVDPFISDISDKIQTTMPLRRDVAYAAWMHRFVTDPEAMLVDMTELILTPRTICTTRSE